MMNHVVVIFPDKRTTYKVLKLGYYWPAIFKDSKNYVKRCDSCQRTGRPVASNEMSLKPQVLIKPFEQWALDFVGPINPLGKRTGARYIITATKYLTKWAEARVVKDCSVTTTAWFIFDDIITRFGCLNILMSDQGTHFITKPLKP